MNSLQTFPAPPVEIFVDTRGAKIMEDGASSPDQRDSRDIYLPNHIEAVSHIAVDVGGSLAKVVYFTRSRSTSDRSPFQSPTASPELPSSPLAGEPWGSAAAPAAGKPGLHSRQSSASANGWQHPQAWPQTPPPGASSASSSGSHGHGHGYGYDRNMPSGTLTPTAILRSPNVCAPSIHSTLLKRRSLPAALPGGRLNFVKFETGDIESCVRFLRELIERSARANGVSIDDMRRGVKLMATGGGAHLFYDLFEAELGIEVQREDEMACLITGLNFITLIPDEVFWYSDELVAALHSPLPASAEARADAQALRSSIPLQQPLPRPSPNPPLYAPVFDSHPSPKLPCLLVNIGSGVSIIKVDDFGKFERVSGTSLGGGTLWGLLSLLTDADSFDEMLELSEQGDNANVDMMVGDIYGSVGLNHLGLKSSTIASSFGKVFRKDRSDPDPPRDAHSRRKKFRQEDICKSLLYAISNNIGQIAYMNAEKYNLDRIYFGGCFIRGHQATISTLSYAIRFWSKGTKRAFFLRHEGYLGAIGAWIKHVGVEPPTPSSQGSTFPVATEASSTSSTGSSSPSGFEGGGFPFSAPPAGAEPALSPIVERPETSRTASSSKVVGAGAAAGADGDDAGRGESPRAAPSLPAMLAEALGGLSIDGVAHAPRASSPLRREANGTGGAAPRPSAALAATVPAATSVGAGGAAPATGAPSSGGAAAAASGDEASGDDLSALLSSLTAQDRALLGPVLAMGADAGERAARGDTEVSVEELMRRFEAAEGAADGIEGRLDALLEKLDGMLESGDVDVDVDGDQEVVAAAAAVRGPPSAPQR
ncbi:related to pantothenate kinase [Pseudozyma flocculosa]|uniref:Related to pantothenate kinase n=1 Tax=Pseudozyma flocculosa TaxID=84751 RepID=A0A5C3F8H5_9BASI|nr:related to pantothenate kinase [Pseudozyma flocculosa]